MSRGYTPYTTEWERKLLRRPKEMYEIFNPEIPGLEPPNPGIEKNSRDWNPYSGPNMYTPLQHYSFCLTEAMRHQRPIFSRSNSEVISHQMIISTCHNVGIESDITFSNK
jgi:hypothetical protein